MNELLDAHLISSLSEQAELVGSVNASLMKSAQWAIGTHKNSLMCVGTLVEAARMTAFDEQAKFAALASAALAESAQRAIGTHKSSLAYVDALVDSMRTTAFSGVSAQQVQGLLAGLSEEIRTLTAISPVVASQMQAITQGLTSFSTQAFEALKGAQEVWRETVCLSAEFARLQGIVGTNLAQVLREQALYYQTWVDGEYDAYTEAFAVCADYLFYRALRIVRNVEDACTLPSNSATSP